MRRFCSASSRAAASCRGWSEVFLNALDAGSTQTTGEAVQQGHSVVLMYDAACCDKLQVLRQRASLVAAEQRRADDIPFARTNANAAVGRVRMKADHMLDSTEVAMVDSIFHRAISTVERQLDLRQMVDVFARCSLERSFFANEHLRFTGGEPAINVYTSGGSFKPQ